LKIEIRTDGDNLVLIKGRALREIVELARKNAPCYIVAVSNHGPLQYEAILEKIVPTEAKSKKTITNEG